MLGWDMKVQGRGHVGVVHEGTGLGHVRWDMKVYI